MPNNPKIKRCTDCNTFVSAAKTGSHTEAECSRRQSMKKTRGPSKNGGKKGGKVNDKKRDALEKLLDAMPKLTEKQRNQWKKRIHG